MDEAVLLKETEMFRSQIEATDLRMKDLEKESVSLTHLRVSLNAEIQAVGTLILRAKREASSALVGGVGDGS